MSKAMAFLMGKRLWRFRYIHLIIAALVATVMVAILLFQGYLVALAGDFHGKLNYPTIPSDILVRVDSGQGTPTVYRSGPRLEMQIWSAMTEAGRVELAGVGSSLLPEWPLPADGDVWLPASQRGVVYQQQVGDRFTLTLFNGREWDSAAARVAGYYEDGGYLSPVLVSRTWLSGWTRQSALSTVQAYAQSDLQDLRRWASTRLQVQLLTEQDISRGASDLVYSLYSGGNTAVMMGAIFLALGFGVMALLTFFDSRTELAILKAMGTRPREAGWLLWGEFALSALVGVLLAWGVSNWLTSRLGTLIVLNWRVFRSALLIAAVSYGLALLAPARLAQQAQVNELLLRRPVLLFSQSVSSLGKKEPCLDDLLSHGWSCIKLEQDGDAFPGIIVRPPGSSVKAGETLAWQSTWFGMGEKRYVAPHDGILMVADRQRGVLAIEPAGS